MFIRVQIVLRFDGIVVGMLDSHLGDPSLIPSQSKAFCGKNSSIGTRCQIVVYKRDSN